MRHINKSIICIFITLFLSLNLFAETTMYVSYNQVQLREKATVLSKQKGVLSYATAVTVLETKGNWTKVQSVKDSSLKGWVKTSNLTKKKLSATALASTNVEELALAGKGSENSLKPQSLEETENEDSIEENESESEK